MSATTTLENDTKEKPMRYMQCRCGERMCWTTMGHPSCDFCEKCGSTLAEGPNTHVDPTPHTVLAEIENGKVVARCTRCNNTRPTEEATNLRELRSQLRSATSALDDALPPRNGNACYDFDNPETVKILEAERDALWKFQSGE